MGLQQLAPVSTDPEVIHSQRVLKDLTHGYRPRDFAVRFWDGTTWEPEPGQAAAFTLVLNHPGSLRKMFWPPRPIQMARAYIYDDFNVEGDMLAFTGFCRHLASLRSQLSLGQRLGLGWRLWRLPQVDRPREGRQEVTLTGKAHTKDRDKQAISYHYDISNEFFSLFLDPRVVYTCAVFKDPQEDLATAQENKLDLVCRKLRLKPGERLLDVGCGWGGLVVFAAQNYGARVVGVTLSKEQAAFGREQIRKAGLEGRCRIEHSDYRDVPDNEPFDKIATLEVLEHMGEVQFPTYFQKCWRLLRPGGSILIQQITRTGPARMMAAREFNQRFVFPDGQLVPISFTQVEAEKAGFEVRDVECFREHYSLTLQHWLNLLEARHDELVRATDEATYRIFRLYLAGALLSYNINLHNLHQLLVVKPNGFDSGYPLSREDWYQHNGR